MPYVCVPIHAHVWLSIPAGLSLCALCALYVCLRGSRACLPLIAPHLSLSALCLYHEVLGNGRDPPPRRNHGQRRFATQSFSHEGGSLGRARCSMFGCGMAAASCGTCAAHAAHVRHMCAAAEREDRCMCGTCEAAEREGRCMCGTCEAAEREGRCMCGTCEAVEREGRCMCGTCVAPAALISTLAASDLPVISSLLSPPSRPQVRCLKYFDFLKDEAFVQRRAGAPSTRCMRKLQEKVRCLTAGSIVDRARRWGVCKQCRRDGQKTLDCDSELRPRPAGYTTTNSSVARRCKSGSSWWAI